MVRAICGCQTTHPHWTGFQQVPGQTGLGTETHSQVSLLLLLPHSRRAETETPSSWVIETRTLKPGLIGMKTAERAAGRRNGADKQRVRLFSVLDFLESFFSRVSK